MTRSGFALALALLTLACEREDAKSADASPKPPAPVFEEATLLQQATCLEMQKLPALAEAYGASTFSDPESISPKPGHCAYFGEDGSLNINVLAVAPSPEIAQVYFEAFTRSSPERGSGDDRATRLATSKAALEKVQPTADPTVTAKLEELVSLSMLPTKTYSRVADIGDQAALQEQVSKTLDMTVRYLYVRTGNAIVGVMPRPQAGDEEWEVARPKMMRALPPLLELLARG